MTDYEREPIRIVLARLMAEHEMGLRELARATQKTSNWGSPESVSRLLSGKQLLPSEESMEAFARVFQIRPETFAEYRMRRLRRALDPGRVPFEMALMTLERFE